jgi:hypothetical protein
MPLGEIQHSRGETMKSILLAVAMLALVGCSGNVGKGGDDQTGKIVAPEARRARLASVKIGMPYQDVKAILGEQDSYVNEGSGSIVHRFRFSGGVFASMVYVYADGNGSEFGVGLENEKVIGKGGFDHVQQVIGRPDHIERRGK